MIRIVLTGGPGAGKTVISARLAIAHPQRYVRVPEAATQVYDHLQTRWDRLTVDGRRGVQRRIYQTQRQQEDRIAAEHPDRALILDRGTIDGAAYWPDGPDDYWRDLATTAETELARYDAVIWLQTSAALGMYDGESSNPRRHESAEAALAAGELLQILWHNHPRLHCIDAFPTLDEKFTAVESLLARIYPR